MLTKAKIHALEFIKKEKVGADVYSFYFSSDQKFDFFAGQYLQIVLPHERVDDRGTSRFFTIASSPTEKTLMITTRKGKSSFKKTLFDLQKGAIVQGFGPMGKFVISPITF